MINLTELTWQEFLLRTLTLHWLTATVVVLFVTAMIAALSRLNATTRHNIWLLTLVSLVLMPLLIFAPRPDVNLPKFSLSAAVENSGSAAPESPRTPTESAFERTLFVESENSKPGLDAAAGTTDATTALTVPESRSIPSSDVQISLASVVKGIFIFWLVGVAFLLRRLWGEYRAARELELQSDSVTPYFERRFDKLCARLGIDERPLLRFHAGINAPMTVGLMHVWVVIPMTWRETIDDSVFDQTLTHELGHIARKDPAIHTLQRLLSILFWMYPAVWYVSRQLEVERESACDDWVLTHDGKSATYATNLLDVAESLYLQPQVLAVGCLRSHSQLSRRIQNLLNKSSDHKVHNSWKLLALTSVGLMATLSVSAVVWPDARQLAPAADLSAESPLPVRVSEVPVTNPEINAVASLPFVPPPPSVAPVATTDKTISRFQSSAKPQTVPLPAAEPLPKPKPLPTVDVQAQKFVAVVQDENGKLTIERHRSGKTHVFAEPEITAKDPVLYAAWTGDTKTLKRLIKQGKDLNHVYARSMSPRTALEAAILKGDKSTVQTMIDLNVDLSPDTPAGAVTEMLSPLTVAAMTGRYDIARLLIENDAKPDDGTLVSVAQNRDARMMELFLDRNECDCLDTDEALLVAIKNQDTRTLDVLLQYDVEVDKGAMVFAVQSNNTKTVKKLLKHYSDDVDTPILTLAIQNRNSAIVDSLIKAGAVPGDGALTLAVQQRDTQLVQKLLSLGADAEEGALVLAIQQRNARLVDVLINAGAPIDDGALVMALQLGDAKTVRSLLKHGPHIQGGALVIAIQKQDVELVRMLLDAGAEVEDGALIVAAQTGNTAIIKLIRERSGRTEAELQSGVLRAFEEVGNYGKNYQASVQSQAAAYSNADSTNRNAKVNSNINTNKHGVHATANKAHGDFSIPHWPVHTNKISLGFDDTSPKYGSRNEPHEALDFPVKAGSPVYAVAAGYVKESRFSSGYGNYILIDHGNGYKTRYANNKVNKVKKGDYVSAHEIIALVGNTAKDSTGPHLHFEVRLGGKKIDPQLVFAGSK